MRNILFIAIVISSSILITNKVEASSVVEICNSSRQNTDLTFAIARRYWDGKDVWKELGWYTITPKRCEMVVDLPTGHIAGFAFLISRGNKHYNPDFDFSMKKGPKFGYWEGYNRLGRMCVGSTGFPFSIDNQSERQIGRNCLDDDSIKISFFVQGLYNNKEFRFNIDPDEQLTANTHIKLNADPKKINVRNYIKPKNSEPHIDDIAFESSISKAQARVIYDERCKKGSSKACFYAAESYSAMQFPGDPPQDRAQAIKLYNRACELGHASSCHTMGRVYSGRKEWAKARASFKKSCDDGGFSSCAKLAGLLISGRGGDKDVAGANAMHRSARNACQAGDNMACRVVSDEWPNPNAPTRKPYTPKRITAAEENEILLKSTRNSIIEYKKHLRELELEESRNPDYHTKALIKKLKHQIAKLKKEEEMLLERK